MPLKNIVIMRKYAHVLTFSLFFSLLFTATASASITYDSGTNTITVTGYTEASPCTFNDIYNADVANGWGVVSQQCDNQFCFNCTLTIGDGSTATYFHDNKKEVVLKDDWLFKQNSTSWFGILDDASSKQTSRGVMFIADPGTVADLYLNKEDGAVLHFYSCSFTRVQEGAYRISLENADNIYNCLGAQGLMLFKCNGDVCRATIQKTSTALNICGASFDDVLITGSSSYDIIVSYLAPSTITMRNITIYGSSAANIRCYGFGNSATQTLYLINSHLDWTFSWYYSTYGVVYRQYEFDLKVIDKDNTPISGATVKIWDKNSNLIVDTTTDANGVIATQTISRGYYNQANGDTLQEYSPHRIKVEKAGYTTYEADFTLEAKTDWTIALQTAGGGTANATYALIGTATPLGARKTTMAAAFVLLSGMFMMMLAKRHKEDEQDVT